VRVSTDQDLCIGAGRCQLTAPDVFEADDDGLVVVLHANPDEARRGDVEASARLCPAGAITIGPG
jgi:ferredoxin